MVKQNGTIRLIGYKWYRRCHIIKNWQYFFQPTNLRIINFGAMQISIIPIVQDAIVVLGKVNIMKNRTKSNGNKNCRGP